MQAKTIKNKETSKTKNFAWKTLHFSTSILATDKCFLNGQYGLTNPDYNIEKKQFANSQNF